MLQTRTAAAEVQEKSGVPIRILGQTPSITKALLKDINLIPPKVKFPLPYNILGRAAQTYYGGRTEAHIRLTEVPCAYYDATSEYPTAAILLEIWRLLRARDIEVRDCTAEVKALLQSLTVEQLLDKKTWPRLAFFAKIRPQGDVVPVRAPYDGKSTTIGVNHLYSEVPLYYAGPDLAAGKILSGQVPEVLEAFQIIPHGVQSGLKQIIIGKRPFDPIAEDFFIRIIEERQQLKNSDKHHPHVLMLKIVANALYGVFAELNSQSFSHNLTKQVQVFSGDCEPFITKSDKVETPGLYHFIPAASLITAGGRCLLAMFEALVRQAGGQWAMTDTDSLICVASEKGGLIPCEGGQEQIPDGRPAVRALTWKRADELAQRFDKLNPYDPTIIPHLFKKEDCNFNASGQQMELRYFGVSSKRYFCFRRVGKRIVVIKPSQHGLGVYFRPDKRPRYQAPDCLDDHKYPQSIIDDWLWVFNEHTNPELNQASIHPFADNICMRKVRVSTPRELAALRRLNPEVFPFNFGISPVLQDPEDLVLVAPMNSHPEQWRQLEYVDIYTGHKYRLFDSFSRQHKATDPLPQTYGAALQQFLRHPESKYDGNVGLLRRWTVRATGDPHLLGKEVERRREQGDDLANILMEAPIEYVRVRYGTTEPLPPLVIEKLKRHGPIKQLARETNLARNVIRRAIRGKPIWKHSRVALMELYESLRYGSREHADGRVWITHKPLN